MTTATATAPTEHVECASIGDRATEAVRKATHLSHEVRHLKSLATDAIEDGVHTAKRTLTRGLQQASDLKDQAVYRVKREPLKAMSFAFGAGVLLGILFGRIGRKPSKV